MKKTWPAPLRNADPILAVLRDALPSSGLILEIASGSGQHAAAFSAAVPGWQWQPSDRDAENLRSIDAWATDGPANFLPPITLDVLEAWPTPSQCDAVVCINMIHIAPIEAAAALMRGAAGVLPVGAPLVTYGPYSVDGVHTALSNAEFDRSLRSRDPRWGVRDVMEVEALANHEGLALETRHSMPANNFCLVFRRR